MWEKKVEVWSLPCEYDFSILPAVSVSKEMYLFLENLLKRWRMSTKMAALKFRMAFTEKGILQDTSGNRGVMISRVNFKWATIHGWKVNCVVYLQIEIKDPLQETQYETEILKVNKNKK